jgi:hypothetical protein
MLVIQLIIQCAIVGFVYSELLITEGHILYPLYRFMEKKLTRRIKTELPDNVPAEVKNMPGYTYTPVYRIVEKRHWLLKPLGECPYCMTGELTAFVFVLRLLNLSWFELVWAGIYSICASILIVMAIKKILWTAGA